jgi:hypothetical protein
MDKLKLGAMDPIISMRYRVREAGMELCVSVEVKCCSSELDCYNVVLYP